jgi:hypothetical protein
MYQKRELLKFPIFFLPQDFQIAEYKCQKFHTAEITGYMVVKIKFKEALATILTQKIICFGNW